MHAITTVSQMKAIDSAHAADVDQLVQRAGSAVAWAARFILGGTYGRRVVAVCGPGNNGADGRVAAGRLEAWGIAVTVLDVDDVTDVLPECDLVIDAAFGTGFRGDYVGPDTGNAYVLSVDIPSGVNGETGVACKGAVVADFTVTFAALKPGLLFGDGPEHAGVIEVADIGLPIDQPVALLVDDEFAAMFMPEKLRSDNKWTHAVGVVAGSPGMTGAAHMCANAALRSGSGMVRLWTPGAQVDFGDEVVSIESSAATIRNDVLSDVDRLASVIVGPGLGRDDATVDAIRSLITKVDKPMVIDADGLFAIGSGEVLRDVLSSRSAPTVLTPHDGEFQRLTGSAPGPDRIFTAVDFANQHDVVLLLKGSPTVIASPGQPALVVNSGDQRLATPGTGDVLSGVIGSFLAFGLSPLHAAALGAHVHGRAASRGETLGMLASDVAANLPLAIEDLCTPPEHQ